MQVATVVPLRKVVFQEELTYFTANPAKIGDIVEISVGKRKMLGLVAEVRDAGTSKIDIKNSRYKLRKIDKIKDHSIFSQELMESALDFSKYSLASKSAVFSYLIPEYLKENYDELAKLVLEYKLNEEKPKGEIKPEKLLFQTNKQERISHYKTLVRESFANKKSIYIVLPGEQQIEEFESYFRRGIESFVVSIHSGLTKKTLSDRLNKIIRNTHPVLIIGTAPYLSVPRNDIGTIVLEEESSYVYKTFTKPNLDLRIFVEIFASKLQARLIFADELLRFETIGRLELEGLAEMRPLSFRTKQETAVKLIDKRQENLAGEMKFKTLSDEALIEIQKNLEAGENVFIFTLRKGLATYTICRHCKSAVLCDTCQGPLVLYMSKDGKKRMFVCNKCQSEKHAETTCDECGSWDLVPLGVGSDTVYEEIKEYFPKTEIFRLDKEHVKSKKEAIKTAEAFSESKGAILIGTEMAHQYLREPVNLSLVASFDSLWSIPNFKMSEKALHILFNTLYLTKSLFLIETRNIKDEALKAFANNHLSVYVKEELRDRKKFGYPPYKRFIKLSAVLDKGETKNMREVLTRVFTEYEPAIFGGFSQKEKGKYVTNMLLRTEYNEWSLPELAQGGMLNDDLYNKLSSLAGEFEINTDPEDLF